ncbi:MAG: YcjX family protein, partial [Hyphomicrobiaceae bacterium]|nr:YcjX family protein [Hyphomicrobiaceae bacterium]
MTDAITPSLRLGVTGLSRAGKTVFITAFVHTLTSASASPSLPLEHLKGFRAFLEPQPDDDIPRFAYEQHLKMLQNDVPDWPESTRQISQLRLTLEWEASDTLRRLAGFPKRLHVDVVDYPGEWLLDLSLLNQNYQTWSREINMAAARRSPDEHTQTWLNFIQSPTLRDIADEQIAIEGAQKFTNYLRSVKKHNKYAQFISPGRFLLPGEFDGSPLLTFFPLCINDTIDEPIRPGTLGALLSKRFESYKQQVVRPFFERHFKSLDRQIVLVDVLG